MNVGSYPGLNEPTRSISNLNLRGGLSSTSYAPIDLDHRVNDVHKPDFLYEGCGRHHDKVVSIPLDPTTNTDTCHSTISSLCSRRGLDDTRVVSCSPSQDSGFGLREDDMMFLMSLHRRRRRTTRRSWSNHDVEDYQEALYNHNGRLVSLSTIRWFLAVVFPRNRTYTTVPFIPLSVVLDNHQNRSPLTMDGFASLMTRVDQNRIKFYGEYCLHGLELFHRTLYDSVTNVPYRVEVDPTCDLCYMVSAFCSSRSNRDIKPDDVERSSPPTLYDVTCLSSVVNNDVDHVECVPTTSRFWNNLQRAISAGFFHKGDVLILDPSMMDYSSVAGCIGSNNAPTIHIDHWEEYLWEACLDPRDDLPLRLCLLWLPRSVQGEEEGRTTHHPCSSSRSFKSRKIHKNPMQLLFQTLQTESHHYPLHLIQRPQMNPHITAWVASQILDLVSYDQIQQWYTECGYTNNTDNSTSTSNVPNTDTGTTNISSRISSSSWGRTDAHVNRAG